MIAWADEKKYIATKSLYNACFPEDGSEFCDFYYSNLSRTKNVLLYIDDATGEPLSMLHMFLRSMRYGASQRRVAFLAAVCTHPSHRNRGYSRALMEYAQTEAERLGCEAMLLKPEIPEFYRRLGYIPFVYRKEYTVSLWQLLSYKPAAFDEMFDCTAALRAYNDVFLANSGMFARNEASMRLKLVDYTRFEKCVSSPGGYVLAQIEGDTLVCHEALGADAMPLIRALMIQNSLKSAIIPSPDELPYERKITMFNMIKPLNGASFCGEKGLFAVERY